MKKIIVTVIILTLIPIGYLSAKVKETVDPAKDKTVPSWKGRMIAPEYTYYFYKKNMTTESENKDFSECMMESLKEPIGVATYSSEQGNVFWGYKDPIYEFRKIYMHLGICMGNRGYVIKEHSIGKKEDSVFSNENESR